MLTSQPFVTVLIFFLLFYYSLTGTLLFACAWIEKIPSIKNRKIYDIPVNRRSMKLEIQSTILYCLLLSIVSAFFIHHTGRHFVDFSIFQFTLSFWTSFFLFEFFYYGVHRLLHTKRFFRFHRQHHLPQVNYPLASLSFNKSEMMISSIGLIGLPWFLSFYLPFNIEGWLAYLVFNFSVTFFGHMNYEITPYFYGIRPFNWFFHPILYHSVHHARYNNHYCFYLTFLDRIFGSEWKDWEHLHKQVMKGQPLKTLNARGNSVGLSSA